MDRESLHRAEERVGEMQDVLANLQRGIQTAEHAQEAAERNAVRMRNIAIAALAVALLFALLGVGRRKHSHDEPATNA